MSVRRYLSLLFIFIIVSSLACAYSPADEEPTDTGIWAHISEAHFDIEEEGDMAKITIDANGTASPDVHHCGLAFVVVYADNSTNYDGVFIEGPLNIPGTEPLIFMPVNGTWEHWYFHNVAYTEKDKIGINQSDLGNISSFELWVRAYRDESGMYWNQTYITLTQNVTKELQEFYEEETDNSSLLFYAGIIGIIAAGGIVVFMWSTHNKGGKKRKR
ncbi:MAG: hypothetical protein DRN21_01875 [Thermoplasmata archaeon]|nr:MAG: hypothetical protein FE046_03670 [Thermoplasmata archaeon]RLF40564.1 MAG: hypothetical protein DRN21_01875 [Thermoplasmata archaeon]RLF61495.1 MAG: hypothetical protein DRN37_00985 [Thermoplasmata archaeon]HDN51228.1 hypothetical protein [Thermoplasmatales archaeon]